MLLGVDIVDIDRIENIIKRTPRFLERVYTLRERQYCQAKSNPYPSLAVRYAAKEAVRKLDPIFLQGINFHDIETQNDPNGYPRIILGGKAREKMEEINIIDLIISLSHSKNQAIATVIAKKGGIL